jgi:hypothetical protein
MSLPVTWLLFSSGIFGYPFFDDLGGQVRFVRHQGAHGLEQILVTVQVRQLELTIPQTEYRFGLGLAASRLSSSSPPSTVWLSKSSSLPAWRPGRAGA